MEYDLSSFDPKAPPKKTEAFWAIVNASRAPEEGELADVFDAMGNPNAVTIEQIIENTETETAFYDWIIDRKNRRAIPHRLEVCGYVPVRNDAAVDGYFVIGGKRQAIYARSELPISERFKAAAELVRGK